MILTIPKNFSDLILPRRYNEWTWNSQCHDFWTLLDPIIIAIYICIYIYFPHLEYFFPIVDWSFIREERNLECFSDDQGPGPQGSRRSMNVKKAFSHIGTYTYISIYHGRITFWSSLEFFSAFLATMCRVEWMHV